MFGERFPGRSSKPAEKKLDCRMPERVSFQKVIKITGFSKEKK